ncbi:phosphoribosyltransferase family protein [Kurthia sp. FSL E2-0154]|uniref:ComF family protein n=1 Tax=Kurthia sp. FSL E2-0154 TaxID=2921358 RepID=UPI0030F73530
MQDVLHQFKFLKDIRVADFFAKALKNKVRGMEYDLIIPIPMHVEMEKKRTFSPVEVVLQQAKLPFQSVLEKTTMSQQSKKTYEQRINSSSFFKSLPQVDVSQQKILLIDDLITTGTTIKHAKTILLELGAKSVEEAIFISGKK